MKKGQVCEGVVRRVDFPNKGIVDTGEGMAVVKTGLPGQKVKFIVNKLRNGKAEGRLLEVLEKSPLETGHPCSHFGLCGGCNYLSMPYPQQLAIKEDQVKNLLERVLSKQEEPWQWEGIKGSPVEYEYRNKMEFSFGDEVKDGPLALGMHKRGSFYDVVTVEDCRIVDADYRLILKTTRDYFAQRDVRFYHKMTRQGFLRHLLVRKASKTGEILVALVTSSQNPWGGAGNEVKGSAGEGADSVHTRECAEAVQMLIAGFRDLLLGLEQTNQLKGRFAGILHITNDSLADVVQSDHTEVLYGQEYFYEELLGLKFKISTFSFFQTNSYSAEVLYETVREYVGDMGQSDARQCGVRQCGARQSATDCRQIGSDGVDSQGKVVFDLYSGTGTIAQLMAPAAKKVVGVEIVEEAVEAAKKNATENGLTNCEFIAGDVLKVLDEISEKPDLIILDPPRDGCHPKVLPKILDYGVDRIVYVSCKPTSLVRDLEVFLERGYVVEKAVAVDQFPWTANVECVIMMQRCGFEAKK